MPPTRDPRPPCGQPDAGAQREAARAPLSGPALRSPAVGDLFSGVGGLWRGLAAAVPGARLALACERSRLLLSRFPRTARRFADAGALPRPMPRLHVLLGAPPFQGLSSASQAGAPLDHDESGGHLHTMFDAAFANRLDERPEVIVLEQAPQLQTDNGGRTFAGVVARALEHGYNVAWRVVALESLGVLQARRRAVLLCVRGELSAAAALLHTPPPAAAAAAAAPRPRSPVVCFRCGEAGCAPAPDAAPACPPGAGAAFVAESARGGGRLLRVTPEGEAALQGAPLEALSRPRGAARTRTGRAEVCRALGGASHPALCARVVAELAGAAAAAAAGAPRAVPPLPRAPLPGRAPHAAHVWGDAGWATAAGGAHVDTGRMRAAPPLWAGRAAAPPLLAYLGPNGVPPAGRDDARVLWCHARRAVSRGFCARAPELPAIVASLAGWAGAAPPSAGSHWEILHPGGGGWLAARVVADTADGTPWPLELRVPDAPSWRRAALLPPLPPGRAPGARRGAGASDDTGGSWLCAIACGEGWLKARVA